METYQRNDCFGRSARRRKTAVAVALICLIATATSCRSVHEVVKEIPVPVHDTLIQKTVYHDSTYVDRWHTLYQKGDTVFSTDSQIIIKYIIRTDTAYKYIEKPVEVTVSQIKEVEKPLRWWQKNLMWCGIVFLIVIIVTVIAFCLFLRNAKRE